MMTNSQRSVMGASAGAMFLAIVIGALDLVSNSAATGLATAAISIPHINQPPKDIAEKKTPTAPVALFFQLRWGDGLPHDIDSHVRCYSVVDGEKGKITVNYVQTSQGWLDLKRDDLGRPSVLNIEEVGSNSEVATIPPNTFCQFNVHLYHSHGGILPVKGTLIAIENKDSGVNEKLITPPIPFILKVPGDEKTILTVVWGTEGHLIPDSIQIFPAAQTKRIATP